MRLGGKGPLVVVAALLIPCACRDEPREASTHPAMSNALLVGECAEYCRELLDAWTERAEPLSGLLPESRETIVWTPENAGADLFPFLVLSAEWVGGPEDRERMRRLLAAEIALTPRWGKLPDALELEQLEFYFLEPKLDRLIYGAAEYAKDGLLPLLESLGDSAWTDRLLGIAEDLVRFRELATGGTLPSDRAEVNGEILQVLSRLYFYTGDPRYVPDIERIARAYVEVVGPQCNGLPCHRFDFAAGTPIDRRLLFVDHGSEILNGLTEALLALERAGSPIAGELRAYLGGVFELVAARGLTEEGLLHTGLDTQTLEPIRGATPDTFGYTFGAMLAFERIRGDVDCTPMLRRCLDAMSAGAHEHWPNDDGYADAIESALLLMNRVPHEPASEWVRRMTAALLERANTNNHRPGESYGEGNVMRSARLVARWLTQGTSLSPYRSDVLLGARAATDGIDAVLACEEPYEGVWRFDVPRHQKHMRLPIDIPRVNEDLEWFTVAGDEWYALEEEGRAPRVLLGARLAEGVPVALEAGEVRGIRVRALPSSSDAGLRIDVKGPRVAGAVGAELRLVVTHPFPWKRNLRVLARGAEPIELEVGPGEARAVTLPLPPAEDAPAAIAVHRVDVEDADSPAVGRWTGLAVPGRETVDARLLRRDGVHHGLRYVDTAASDLILALDPGDAAGELELLLLWGARDDTRGGELVWPNGEATRLQQGGYDGFRWLGVPVPPEHGSGELRVRLRAIEGQDTTFVAGAALCRAKR